MIGNRGGVTSSQLGNRLRIFRNLREPLKRVFRYINETLSMVFREFLRNVDLL